jgi:NCS2 family nucleobase:cation symporter-2
VKPRVRPAKLVYAVDERPPPLQLVLLGAQYAAMSAIYLVLVAVVLRGAKLPEAETTALMGISCIALAIGTLLQALHRGPIGSGFLAPPIYSATFLGPSILAVNAGGMALVFGMTIVAGLAEMLIALFLTRLRIVITPVVSGLSVFIVGLQLGAVGVGQFLDVQHELEQSYLHDLFVALVTLAVPVALSIWGRGPLKLLCSLCGLIAGMAAALAVGLISPVNVAIFVHTPWLALPQPALLGYQFDAALLPVFLAGSVAAAVRSVALVTTCQRLDDAAWERPDMANVRKGVLAEGLANVFGGLLGAQGMNMAPSLVGISSVTGVASRAVAYAAAAIMLVVGFVPKLAVIFLLVPLPVAGSLLVFTSCFMISGGMEIMLSRPGSPRATYIIGISTLLALSGTVYPDYFSRFSPSVRGFLGNPLSFGLAAAIGLTLLFRLGTRQHESTKWGSAFGGVEGAVAFVGKTAEGWSISPKIAEAATREIKSLIDRLEDADYLDRGGELLLSTDGLDFRAEITCPGPAQASTADASVLSMVPAYAIDTEEAAVVIGLKTFLESFAAERKEVVQGKDGTKIVLTYGD